MHQPHYLQQDCVLVRVAQCARCGSIMRGGSGEACGHTKPSRHWTAIVAPPSTALKPLHTCCLAYHELPELLHSASRAVPELAASTGSTYPRLPCVYSLPAAQQRLTVLVPPAAAPARLAACSCPASACWQLTQTIRQTIVTTQQQQSGGREACGKAEALVGGWALLLMR